jgi:ATP-dependent DNA helicase RecQ
MTKPFIFKSSFDRPNLFLQVAAKDKVEEQILDFLKSRPNDSGIVYRMTRENTEQTSDYLNKNGIRALPYHAGLGNRQRQKNQEAFNRDEVQVMVATIAFGMGIDKSNVRFVLHGDLPKNMESYYQEIGRAGRDGQGAHCVLYFKRSDIPRIQYFLEQMEDEKEKQKAHSKLSQIIDYASFNSCRRRQILAYFGETYPRENCAACDVCTDKVEIRDATVEAQMVMSAIYRLDERFGAGYVTDVITGADTKRIREFGHKTLKTYGVGTHQNKTFWRSLIDELINRRHLEQTQDQYPVLKLTPSGRQILRGEKNFQIIKKENIFDKKIFDSKVSSSESNPELFQRLRVLRKELASRDGVPPYIIFSDRTLHEMSSFFPASREELLVINGIGEQKLEKYGSDILLEIKKFLHEFPALANKKISRPIAVDNGRSLKKSEGGTIEITRKLALQNRTMQEIARERGLTMTTIAGHLEELLMKGEKIDLDLHVLPERQIEIERAFLIQKTKYLRPVFDKFNGKIPYEEIRLIRGFLVSRGELADG